MTIVRYGTPTEHELWGTTANGNPTIIFNDVMSPREACRAVKAVWTGDGFTCRNFEHPHFDRILDQCGKGLDEAVRDCPWCRKNGVKCGADYLRLWAGSLVQRPKQPLPYLFFWSKENNSGKSSFPRSLGMLFDGGETDVHSALTEQYNGQMAGAVLCTVSEADLPKKAYAKLKNWVDSPTISIREMRMNAYTLPNYAHFIQTANKLRACPVEPHDQRVVVVRVPELPKDARIPWHEEMEPALRSEAPQFLATLLAVKLPPAGDRLFLPVLMTEDKKDLMRANLDEEAPQETQTPEMALAEAVVILARREKQWTGTAGNLLAEIGKGPWSDSAATVSMYLTKIEKHLGTRGIEVSQATKRVQGQRSITISLSA